MTSREKAHVCVIGAGTMGRGIAQIALAAGHGVSLVDPNQAQLEAAAQDIVSRLSRKDPGAGDLVRRQLSSFTDLGDAPPLDGTVVIEAAVETLGTKQAILARALEHFGADCVLATNTSSLSITEIAAGCGDPSRVVGMHFFNPVPVMSLVEVVRGLQSDDSVVAAVADLAKSWGKEVAFVRSAPGFIVNRVARAFYGEALRLLEEGAADPQTIDEVMRSAGRFRMGPFELMDLIGNEVNFAVTRSVWEAFGFDSRFSPSHFQRELVAAGRLGRKSGQGYYRYAPDAEQLRPEPAAVDSARLPAQVLLHGDCPQLEAILVRSKVPFTRIATADSPRIEVPGEGTVLVTRGRTAREESALWDCPAVVIDRCIDPAEGGGVALASSHSAFTATAVALLAQAGIAAYPISDIPGLVVARILSMIANEAWEAAHHQVATPEDIDRAMVLGTSYPMGPFEWSERWSLRSVLDILDSLWAAYRDTRYRASYALRAAVHVTAPVAGAGRPR